MGVPLESALHLVSRLMLLAQRVEIRICTYLCFQISVYAQVQAIAALVEAENKATRYTLLLSYPLNTICCE